MNILSILLFTCFVCIFIYSLGKEYYRIKHAMSFKESLDLTDLPIITFYISNQKFNFMLDTGSNASYIDINSIKELNLNTKKETISIIGFDGNPVESNDYYDLTFYYKKRKYENSFIGMDLSVAFNSIKQATGVQIHGILGNVFFSKYKYVLDFDNLIAYAK